MVKLNNRGFTLVELLAVIVVLSIVVGVSVPTVTHLVSNARYKSLTVSVEEAEKFAGDQWKLKKMDPAMQDESFKNVIGNDYTQGEFITLNIKNDASHKQLIEEMGIPSKGIKTVLLKIYEDNVPCVVIAEITKDSDLYDAKYWTLMEDNKDEFAIPNDTTNNVYYSKCCKLDDVQKMLGSRYGG